MDAKKILVVDDEPAMQRGLEFGLQKAGYQVLVAGNGREALRTLYQHRPDLVVLDVMMPEMDGWETCKRIREVSDCPIIMLTALTGEENVIKGLESGADEYVSKPFGFAELLARVKAVLRRATMPRTEPVSNLVFDGGRLIVDPAKGEVLVNGCVVPMTATEYRLLLYLAKNKGRVLTHAQLLREVWGPEFVDEVGYIKIYIRYIRQKIEEDPAQPKYLLTRRGLGYCFDAEPK